MTILILKLLLALLLVQALVKFAVFFLMSYARRRKLLDAQYGEKTTATKTTDLLLLGIVLLLLGLLLASGQVETVSFAVGLYAGMTLIQTYFHHFSKPLPPAEAPPPVLSPIKALSRLSMPRWCSCRKAVRALCCSTIFTVWRRIRWAFPS